METEAPPAEMQVESGQVTQAPAVTGCSCGRAGATPQFVYAFGRIRCVMPSLGVEREVNQALARANGGAVGLEALQATLGKAENRYLVRQVGWVLAVQGVDRYQLLPRDPADFGLFVHTIREEEWPMTADLVIGVLGPPMRQGSCGHLPTVWFNKLSVLDTGEFVHGMLAGEDGNDPGEQSSRAARALLTRIVNEAANDGSQPIHRAKNFVAVRSSSIYAKTAEAVRQNAVLTNITGQISPLSNGRMIVDVIFEHTHRQTEVVERHFVRVDVTEELPFLVSHQLLPYYA